MKIKKIELEKYRNYKEEVFIPLFNKNIILGENGQGKTNLVESLYLCAFGKSFRTSNLKDLIKIDENYLKINIEYENDENIEGNITYFYDRENNKSIKIDGVNIKKNSDLMENMYIVIFSPEDIKIIKENPEKRRNFLDRDICQISKKYFINLQYYKKVLKQRNSLLKNEYIDNDILDVIDLQLIKYGKNIIEKRNEYIKNINIISSEIHKKISNEKEKINLYYKKSVSVENYAEKLKKSRKDDIFYKRTNVGPHRDDFNVEINGIDLKKYGSQGQQRTAALSIKLSEIEIIKENMKENPILILDDVFSELDENRKKILLEYFDDIQVFITSASKEKIFGDKFFIIEKGKII